MGGMITQEDIKVLQNCFRCPHWSFIREAPGIFRFHCRAPSWHCHYKGQKAKLRELRILDEKERR